MVKENGKLKFKFYFQNKLMIDNSVAEVFACRCKPEDCDYKLQWVESGSPNFSPL